jgi:hypothetical protein
MINEVLSNILTTLLITMGVSIVIAVLGLFAIIRSIRRLDIPPDADFFTTMRHIPLILTILLDLLDFGLDIFSAPIVWIVLDRMGLPNLRNKAVIEALIPFTSPIPLFTLSWIAARLLNLGDADLEALRVYKERSSYRRLRSHPDVDIIDADDYGR